jgi:hypothetical protein
MEFLYNLGYLRTDIDRVYEYTGKKVNKWVAH